MNELIFGTFSKLIESVWTKLASQIDAKTDEERDEFKEKEKFTQVQQRINLLLFKYSPFNEIARL